MSHKNCLCILVVAAIRGNPPPTELVLLLPTSFLRNRLSPSSAPLRHCFLLKNDTDRMSNHIQYRGLGTGGSRDLRLSMIIAGCDEYHTSLPAVLRILERTLDHGQRDNGLTPTDADCPDRSNAQRLQPHRDASPLGVPEPSRILAHEKRRFSPSAASKSF